MLKSKSTIKHKKTLLSTAIVKCGSQIYATTKNPYTDLTTILLTHLPESTTEHIITNHITACNTNPSTPEAKLKTDTTRSLTINKFDTNPTLPWGSNQQ